MSPVQPNAVRACATSSSIPINGTPRGNWLSAECRPGILIRATGAEWSPYGRGSPSLRRNAAREDTGPPWPFWVIVVLTSAMVLGTVIVYGVERAHLHSSMFAIFGVIVAANLFLLLELSHAYLGEVSTSSDPLQEAVWVLSPPAG